MKKLRTVILILLLAALFCCIDLGVNFLWSLLPEANDGIGNFSLLHAVFGIFGDRLWSHVRYLQAFVYSLWSTFALLIAYIVSGACTKQR